MFRCLLPGHDDDSAKVCKGYWHFWRKDTKVCYADLLGSETLSLSKEDSSYFSAMIICFGRQGKCLFLFLLQVGQGEFLGDYTSFFRISKNQVHRNYICPEIFSLGKTTNAALLLQTPLHLFFGFPHSHISLMSTDFLLNSTEISCRPD